MNVTFTCEEHLCCQCLPKRTKICTYILKNWFQFIFMRQMNSIGDKEMHER